MYTPKEYIILFIFDSGSNLPISFIESGNIFDNVFAALLLAVEYNVLPVADINKFCVIPLVKLVIPTIGENANDVFTPKCFKPIRNLDKSITLSEPGNLN